MHTVIAYDITDDNHRARFAAVLAAVGERIQQSVFACELDDDLRGLVLRKADDLVNHATDRVHLIAQCPACASQLHTIGQAHVPRAVEYWIL